MCVLGHDKYNEEVLRTNAPMHLSYHAGLVTSDITRRSSIALYQATQNLRSRRGMRFISHGGHPAFITSVITSLWISRHVKVAKQVGQTEGQPNLLAAVLMS